MDVRDYGIIRVSEQSELVGALSPVNRMYPNRNVIVWAKPVSSRNTTTTTTTTPIATSVFLGR